MCPISLQCSSVIPLYLGLNVHSHCYLIISFSGNVGYILYLSHTSIMGSFITLHILFSLLIIFFFSQNISLTNLYESFNTSQMLPLICLLSIIFHSSFSYFYGNCLCGCLPNSIRLWHHWGQGLNILFIFLFLAASTVQHINNQ